MHRLSSLLVLAALVLTSSCHQEAYWRDLDVSLVPTGTGSQDTATPTDSINEPVDTTTQDLLADGSEVEVVAPTEYELVDGKVQVGGPCTTDDQCLTGFCLTTEFLAMMGQTADVVGGYCTKMFCTTDDPDCDPDHGGKCFDLSEQAGQPVMLCLRLCQEATDCRHQDDVVCHAEEGFEESACIPQDFLDMMETD